MEPQTQVFWEVLVARRRLALGMMGQEWDPLLALVWCLQQATCWGGGCGADLCLLASGGRRQGKTQPNICLVGLPASKPQGSWGRVLGVLSGRRGGLGNFKRAGYCGGWVWRPHCTLHALLTITDHGRWHSEWLSLGCLRLPQHKPTPVDSGRSGPCALMF